MNAAFMQFQRHDSGIHALRLDADDTGVTQVRFSYPGRSFTGTEASGIVPQHDLLVTDGLVMVSG
jgi:hypothetical protein